MWRCGMIFLRTMSDRYVVAMHELVIVLISNSHRRLAALLKMSTDRMIYCQQKSFESMSK